MNFYLLHVVGKWFSLFIVSAMNFLGFTVDEQKLEVAASNIDKNVSMVTEVIPFETVKTYDSSIPSNIQKVLVEGKNGLAFTDDEGNKVTLEPVVHEEIQVGTGAYGVFNGIMTGYGPDCDTCDGKGYVACRTVDKKDFNLIEDGIYYEDAEFGKVRVLAAALSVFPCGTIVEVDSSNLGKFTGIVLDTGYGMRKSLENGIYHFDVAYTTESDEMVAKTTNKKGVTYSVQRWGW